MTTSLVFFVTVFAEESVEVKETDVLFLAEAPQNSLRQTTSYSPSYFGETIEELKTKLIGLIVEVETVWTEKGGYDYQKSRLKSILGEIKLLRVHLQ